MPRRPAKPRLCGMTLLQRHFTCKEPGDWPARTPGRPRVLVEHVDRAQLEGARRALAETGFDVAVCTGSEEGRRCPLVALGHCALVDGADVVVTSPWLAEAPEILAAYDRLGVRPIVVDATEVDIDELAEVAGDAVFLPPPLSAQSLRLAVSEASAYLDV
jgi:hypothetical protein